MSSQNGSFSYDEPQIGLDTRTFEVVTSSEHTVSTKDTGCFWTWKLGRPQTSSASFQIPWQMSIWNCQLSCLQDQTVWCGNQSFVCLPRKKAKAFLSLLVCQKSEVPRKQCVFCSVLGNELIANCVAARSCQCLQSERPSTEPSLDALSVPDKLQIVLTQTSLPTSEQNQGDPQNHQTPIVTHCSLPSVTQSDRPTTGLSTIPSQLPSSYSLKSSGCRRSTLSALECAHALFCTIADVPHTDAERAKLPNQISSIPDNVDFLIHLGDIQSAWDGEECQLGDHGAMADTLKLSRVPVFVVMGGECNHAACLVFCRLFSLTNSLHP